MWIKLWADHGGGHQNHSEKYLWFAEEPGDEFLENTWNDWINAENMNNCVGGSEIVEKPPIKEIEYMLSNYRAQEEHAHKMIRVLDGYSIQRKAKNVPTNNHKEKTEVSQILDDLLRDIVVLRKNVLHCGYPGSWRIVAKGVVLVSERLDQLASRMQDHADRFKIENDEYSGDTD